MQGGKPDGKKGASDSLMHVISASRRTDVPAFHAEWVLGRFRAGFADVAAPFGKGVFRTSLDPQDCLAVVFWTKDAAPLVPHLDELFRAGHCFTFLYTINNYPPVLEPHVPGLDHTLGVVKALVQRFGAPVFRWRYDTIVLTEEMDRKWHIKNFTELCRLLSGLAREGIFSFCDYYRKTVRNIEQSVPSYYRPTEAESFEMAREMALVAKEWGITLASCAHDFLLSPDVAKARCIDPDHLSAVVDSPERKAALTTLKFSPTRKECGCAHSKDIGAYDTCGHGCVYCYANSNPALAQRNLHALRPEDPCLDPHNRAGCTKIL
jgi:hypothetical protein